MSQMHVKKYVFAQGSLLYRASSSIPAVPSVHEGILFVLRAGLPVPHAVQQRSQSALPAGELFASLPYRAGSLGSGLNPQRFGPGGEAED